MKRNLNKIFALTLLASSALIGTQALAGKTQQGLFVKEDNTVSGEELNLRLPVDNGAVRDYFAGSLNITVGTTLREESITNGKSFLAYCIDPFQFSSTTPLSYTSSALSSLGVTQAADVTRLYSQSYASTDKNKTNSAAFQLALWELGKDDGNLSTGNVHTTNSTTSTVVNKASDMINLVKNGPTGSTQYAFNLYTNDVKQDYLVATPLAPVPEPETYAMLLAGLTLMGWMSRKHRASGTSTDTIIQ
jgi:hypothetical protein